MHAEKGTGTRGIPLLRIALLAGSALFVILTISVLYIGFHDRGLNLDFDPNFVADTETQMWKNYYEGGSQASLGRDLLKLMHVQFGLSYRTAILIAQDVAKATVKFRTTKDRADYENKILPDLVRGYTRLRRAVNGNWNPKEIARAEMDWWIARRDPEHSDPQSVGKSIAYEYSLFYAKENAHIQKAGLLRAQAAHERDVQGKAGVDWQKINSMLRESYSELLKGIHE